VAALAKHGDIAAATGRVDEARRVYEAVLERYVELGNLTGIVGIRTGLADLALRRNDPQQAEAELDAARSFAREQGMTGWDEGLEYFYAEVALATGDLDAAQRHLAAALAGAESSLRVYRTLMRRAELHVRRDHIRRAKADVREALSTLDRWRDGLDREGLRRYVFQIREHRYDPDLGMATVLAAMVTDGRVGSAFALAERQRGRELFDQLVRAVALTAGDGENLPRKPPAPGITADRWPRPGPTTARRSSNT
jgi:predicted Zn-dependent protease